MSRQVRLLLFLVVSGLDVVEAELVNILGRRNNAVQDVNNRATVIGGFAREHTESSHAECSS